MAQNPIYAFLRKQQWLDRPATAVQSSVKKAVANGGEPARNFKDVLHGVWLKHPLHAAITDVPIGAWTAAMVLDGLSAATGGRFRRGADAAVALGLLAGVPAAISGMADWSDLYGERRRVGMAHALANVVGTTLFAASLARRASKKRTGASLLSTLGYLSLTFGAYVGGEMVYRLGVQVDRNAWHKGIKDFAPVLDEAQLPEGQPRRVVVADVPVLLVRQGGTIHALVETCSHAGGPLADGQLHDGKIVCPWHGSHFRLEDGCPIHGPAVYYQPHYAVRVRDGRIEVKQSDD